MMDEFDVMDVNLKQRDRIDELLKEVHDLKVDLAGKEAVISVLKNDIKYYQMGNKFVYHYHATRQLANGQIEHIDGIIMWEKMVSGDWAEYRKIKEAIDGVGDLVLRSLTLVGYP